MTPRHVKAFLKDDKIIYEINEKEMPKPYGNQKIDTYESDLQSWQSQNKYLEGAEEQFKEHRQLMYNSWYKVNALIWDNDYYIAEKQGIQIDPSLIEERNGFIYLKESEGQDEKRFTEGDMKSFAMACSLLSMEDGVSIIDAVNHCFDKNYNFRPHNEQ